QQRAQHNGQHDHAAGDHVLSRRVREERYAVLVYFLVVTAAIRRARDHSAPHRPFIYAEPEPEPEVEAHHADEDPGSEEHVHGEEPRQRAPRDDRPSEQEMDERVADTRSPRRDRRADPEPPVGVLIPAKDLAREGHAERAEEQEDADDPREL